MVQEEFREVFPAQVTIAIFIELEETTGELLGGNDFAFAEAAAEFDGKIETSHVILGYTTTRG